MINLMKQTASYFIPAYCTSGFAIAKYLVGQSKQISPTDKKIMAAALVAILYPAAVAIFREISSTRKTPNFLRDIFPFVSPLGCAYQYSFRYLAVKIPKLIHPDEGKGLFSKKWNKTAIKLMTVLFFTSRPVYLFQDKLFNKML
ncbi:hypothetical protein [Rhabdochlamydiaceae symbiont of Dictyostelium giganteum]|uniref:hypothetical protein n=1 Tax=Rhabdochlamydiaceae symbiont of Dictyostelium giganteum TaxID=3342349 RepID=UPI00384DC766